MAIASQSQESCSNEINPVLPSKLRLREKSTSHALTRILSNSSPSLLSLLSSASMTQQATKRRIKLLRKASQPTTALVSSSFIYTTKPTKSKDKCAIDLLAKNLIKDEKKIKWLIDPSNVSRKKRKVNEENKTSITTTTIVKEQPKRRLTKIQHVPSPPKISTKKVSKKKISSKYKEQYQHVIVQHDYHDHAIDPPVRLQYDFPLIQNRKYQNDHDSKEEKGKIQIEEKYSCDDRLPELSKGFETRKRSITSVKTFPAKLYDVLEAITKDKQCNNVMSWQPHGRCFVIHDYEMFKTLILPIYFHLRIMTSFQRQLNLYGFKRITESNSKDRNGYYHEYFLRGRYDLLGKIQRMKIKGAGVRAKSNPKQEPNFWLDYPWMTSAPSTTSITPSIVLSSTVDDYDDDARKVILDRATDDRNQDQPSIRVKGDIKLPDVIVQRSRDVVFSNPNRNTEEDLCYRRYDVVNETPLLDQYNDFSMTIDDMIPSSIGVCNDEKDSEAHLASTQISSRVIPPITTSMTTSIMFPHCSKFDKLHNTSNHSVGQSDNNIEKVDKNRVDMQGDCPLVMQDDDHQVDSKSDDSLTSTTSIDECFVPCHFAHDPNDIVLIGWGKPFHYMEAFHE